MDDEMTVHSVRESLLLLAYLNLRHGRADGALAFVETLVAVDGSNPAAWRALATVHLALDQNPEAMDAANRAIEMGASPPDLALCHLILASALHRLGRTGEAEQAAAKYLQARKNAGTQS